MSYGAVVLARMDSARLHEKALRTTFGWPLIEVVCRRLLSGGFTGDRVALATSDRAIDDPLEKWARSFGIAVYRGDVADVSGRFLACADSLGWRALARINGDSPFIDGALILESLRRVASSATDFVTNLSPRTYPYGMSVEAVNADTYRVSLEWASTAEREHVTLHLYRRLPARTIHLECPAGDLSTVRLTVDELADEQRIDSLLRCSHLNIIDADGLAIALQERQRLSL